MIQYKDDKNIYEKFCTSLKKDQDFSSQLSSYQRGKWSVTGTTIQQYVCMNSFSLSPLPPLHDPMCCVCLRRSSGVGYLTTWKSKANFAINTNFKFLRPIVNVGIILLLLFYFFLLCYHLTKKNTWVINNSDLLPVPKSLVRQLVSLLEGESRECMLSPMYHSLYTSYFILLIYNSYEDSYFTDEDAGAKFSLKKKMAFELCLPNLKATLYTPLTTLFTNPSKGFPRKLCWWLRW